MKNTYKEIIKSIGRNGNCSDEELLSFLPNFPTLRGSEFIFTIGWADAHEYIDEGIEFFVRGLHLIEQAYKLKTGNEFGFGSPSPTAKVIDALSKQDSELAETLRMWVISTGGNYYLKQESDLYD